MPSFWFFEFNHNNPNPKVGIEMTYEPHSELVKLILDGMSGRKHGKILDDDHNIEIEQKLF